MSSKKVFLGLAVVGGGLYYYDQNVQPIFPRQELPKPIANRANDASKEVEKDFKTLDAKSRDIGSQLKKTVSDLATDIRAKTESTVAAIKDTETYSKWSKKMDDYTKEVEIATDELEKKPLFSRLAAKYIDFVNKVAQTDDEKLKELASSTSDRQQELKKELADTRQLWSVWWPGKKAEANAKADELKSKAEKEKDLWIKWGTVKKADAEKKADELKAEAEKNKDLWLSWGSAKKDEVDRKAQDASSDLQATYQKQKNELHNSLEAGRQSAVDAYYSAKSEVEKLLDGEKTEKLIGQAKADHDRHLEAAKKDLLSAAESLKKYGSDLLDRVTGEKK